MKKKKKKIPCSHCWGLRVDLWSGTRIHKTKTRNHLSILALKPHFLVGIWILLLTFSCCLVAKSCPALPKTMDCSIQGSSVLHYLCAAQITSTVSDSLWHYGLYPASLLCPWDSPGKNTGLRCNALLQRIFQTQGSNLHFLWLLHWQKILCH